MKKIITFFLSLVLAFSSAFTAFPANVVYADKENGYMVTFVMDGHASVTVSTTQSFSNDGLTENATSAYARDSDTGEIDTSGSGQVNFLVIPDSGYSVKEVTVDGKYKNLKSGKADTGYENGYRITKIQSDLTVTVTTQKTETAVDAEQLSQITVKDGYLTSVTFPEVLSGTVYTAVYEANGHFTGAEVSQISKDNTIYLSGDLLYDTETEDIRCFLVDSEMRPLSKLYLYSAGTYEEDGIIHLCGQYIDASGIDGVSVSGTTVTISEAGEYFVEGTLDDGQVVISVPQKSDEVTLHLTEVSVTSSTGNALNALCGCVVLANTAGSTSLFKSTYATDDDAGTGIYSKSDLTIKGEDASTKLIASSNGGNAIRCKADLEIGMGDLEVTAGNHGIKGDESVKITKKAGTVTVVAAGDSIKTDAISSSTLALEYGKGNIVINGGILDLTSGGDGIQADDTVTINGGSVKICADGDGIKANTVNTLTYDDDDVASYVEGNVVISDGSVDITAQEDGIKAAGLVNITGGSITIDAETDGIQSGVDYTDESGNILYSAGNLTISDGELNITAGGGAAAERSDNNSHKGIKAYDELVISGGNFTIDSYDDAVHSNYKVTVTGGSFEISTGDDGMHADYKLALGTEGGSENDYSLNISTSYEGLEGSVIEYLSGTTYVYSTDDGVNAAGDYSEDGTLNTGSSSTGSSSSTPGQQPEINMPGKPGSSGGRDPGADDSSSCGSLYIKGGRLYVLAKGDGLDSNGNITMSDGIVVVNGTTSGGNGVFDKGDSNNVFSVTGGTLVGFGTTDMQDNPAAVSNGTFSSTAVTLKKGTPISVSTDSGSLIIVPEITMQRALLYVTCGDMTKGKSYSLTYNASTAGATDLLTKVVENVSYGLFKIGS